MEAVDAPTEQQHLGGGCSWNFPGKVPGTHWCDTDPPGEMPGYLPSCCLMELCQWRFSRSG